MDQPLRFLFIVQLNAHIYIYHGKQVLLPFDQLDIDL